MIKKLSNKNLLLFFGITSLILGVIFRTYNLNFENLWFDEIVSFWVSDPDISLNESYKRNNLTESAPYFFNFLLKILHTIFGYSPNIGRYFSCIIGILSIYSAIYLSKTIKANHAYFLVLFLVSLNVFLIKYSQEIRVYSLMFLLTSTTLIFYFKIINEINKNKFFSKNSLYFILFQILSILSHPFTIIVFLSILIYSLLSFYFYRRKNKLLNTSIIVIFLFVIFYLPFYFINTESYIGWILNPDYKFYTNFYFSKFFGSRLLGIIHLIILLFLLFKFKSKLVMKFKPEIVLIIIIILSYALPIIYGYLYEPILSSRYIIFILAPIIILISYLIFELKNSKIKYFIIYFLIIITLGNQITESNVEQFYKNRLNFKPQYDLVLKDIDKSNHKNFKVNMSFLQKNKNDFNAAINNYFNYLILVNKLKIYPIKINEINNNDHFWEICLKDIDKFSCNDSNKKNKYEILEERNYNGINLKLMYLSK